MGFELALTEALNTRILPFVGITRDVAVLADPITIQRAEECSMSKFNDLDSEIIRCIRDGAGDFWTLMRRARHLCEPLATDPNNVDRVLDRRLQALRKSGQIDYSRSSNRWSVISK